MKKNIRVSDYVCQLMALFFSVFGCCCECQFDRSNKFIKLDPIDISRQRAHSTIRAKVVFKITRWALISGTRNHVVEVRQQTEMRQFEVVP
jgi:hypothetical protein